jgi:hypothetical protein
VTVSTPALAKHSCFPNLRVYLIRVVSQPRYGDIETFIASVNERTGGMELSTWDGLLCITARVHGPTQQPQS